LSRFTDRFRIFIRSRHLAYRTEKTYCHWAVRFLRYCGYQNEKQMVVADIAPFLTHLSVERQVSINTQKTALNALITVEARLC
jgi:hypothetical protein